MGDEAFVRVAQQPGEREFNFGKVKNMHPLTVRERAEPRHREVLLDSVTEDIAEESGLMRKHFNERGVKGGHHGGRLEGIPLPTLTTVHRLGAKREKSFEEQRARLAFGGGTGAHILLVSGLESRQQRPTGFEPLVKALFVTVWTNRPNS